MKIYLVGGAVRDQLLGLPVKERDYVVVGATPEEMIAQGYKPVGKEFPVFLHPETREEYALARTERKIAKGYKGFEFYAAPTVTLEEDLKRRDLTINAMAETLEDKIVDPYGGEEDLKNKILRHVSPAFAEDPVRILRVARFAARFSDFKVHPETLKLMQQMVHAGEVNALVAERVWQEFIKALQQQHPERFFEILDECGALEILFPEIKQHLNKIILILRFAVQITEKIVIRFAAMFAEMTAEQTEQFCKRYKVPTEYRELALLMARYFQAYQKIQDFNADELLKFLEQVDAFRRQQRFNDFLIACEINDTSNALARNIKLKTAYQAANEVSPQTFIARGLKGTEIAKAMQQARVEAIKKKMG